MSLNNLSLLTLLFVFGITAINKSSDISVSVHKPIAPVFVNTDLNPVLKFEILTTATGVEIEEIALDIRNPDDSIIESIEIYYTGSDSDFNDELKFGSIEQIERQSTVHGKQVLEHERNYFWVSIKLSERADLLDHIHINSSFITVNGTAVIAETDRREIPLKTAKLVRERNQDDVHTYRIPGMVTTNEGTLIAVYDIRRDDSSDLQGDIDVGMSRSIDGGETWESMKIIMDMGTWGGKPENENGIGDPAVLVDRNRGTIWVSALWIHGYPGTHAWNSSQQGITPEETGQFVLVKSDDDGQTWSDPINITEQIKDPEWYLLLMGPGNGITMKDGTLVFAAQYKDGNQMPYSTIVYSEDHGESWKIGEGVRSNTTEAQVVELDNGTLMINMRDNRGGARSIYTTNDLGQTWDEHPSSRIALPEPVSMASLIHSDPVGIGYYHDYLVFSNPNSTAARVNMSVKISKDHGTSWPEQYQLLLDENRGFGYSSLTMVDENIIGILYEGVRDLYFQKISLDEILNE